MKSIFQQGLTVVIQVEGSTFLYSISSIIAESKYFWHHSRDSRYHNESYGDR